MDRHKRRPRRYKGFGGQQDGNELPLVTAVRESEEELGLRVRLEEKDEVRRVTIPGVGGDHEFVAYLMSLVSSKEDRIIPGPEIMIVSLFTLPQFIETLKSGIVLERHVDFLKWWDTFLPRDIISSLKKVEDPELEIHIYKSRDSGISPEDLSPEEKIVRDEAYGIDQLGFSVWHAYVFRKTSERIREFLTIEDEKEMERIALVKKKERRVRPRPEPDDDFLFGRKSPVKTDHKVVVSKPPKEKRIFVPEIRGWKVYEFAVGSPSAPPLSMESPGFFIRRGENILQSKSLSSEFYWDYELIAAGLIPGRRGILKRLAKEWNGHKANSLIMVISDSSQTIRLPTTTYVVENKK